MCILVLLQLWEDEDEDDSDDSTDEENVDTTWGGSLKGRSPNKPRDFTQAYDTVIGHYFSGDASLYDEVDFERRFGMPREVFNTIWENIQGKGSFKQHTNGLSKELGIRPLVRLIAVLRTMKYGDVYDRNDEHFQIAASTVRHSCTEFWELMIEIFGPHYLNRSPTADEKNRLHCINSKRGFPGHLASWDCKHFNWQLCPRRLAGQATILIG
jgi:hypothetical protein